MDQTLSRRRFLRGAASFGAFALAPVGLLSAAETEELETAPAEDLMREHGVLNRILLIYDHFAARVWSGRDDQAKTLNAAASLLKRFIEDYHERLEEEHLFPRFKGHDLAPLVEVLKAQHEAGRKVTGDILRLSGSKSVAKGGRAALVEALRRFTRMYRPHEAREDTVLFPAFKTLVSKKEYEELGDRFEDKEHQLFGKAGFEGVVAEVAELEKTLGLYDLAQFTPKTP